MPANASGASENSSNPLDIDPLSAADFVQLQQRLVLFVRTIKEGTESEKELGDWKKMLKVPDLWAKLRKYVPEFDVRE